MIKFLPGLWLSAERLVDAQEIVMSADDASGSAGSMVPVDRKVGLNDVGIVAWMLTLRSPECPQGRKVGGEQ